MPADVNASERSTVVDTTVNDAQSENKAIPGFRRELERAARRRRDFRVERPANHDGVQWALAFSGGGIRSATFCLGVLQGLAKSAPAPVSPEGAPATVDNSRRSLLPQF